MVDLNLNVVKPIKMTPQSRFRFRCHPGVPCFTECCGRTTIILTPYDILRLKQRLGITSDRFLELYASRDVHDKSGLPLVLMDMPRYGGVCPFVRPVSGCQVYTDRPATCRYYPVGQGTLITEEGLDEFYFLVKEDHCKGFLEDAEWTVETWKKDQGADYYDEMNREWKAMMLRRSSSGKPDVDERHQNLFYMVMYDLDQFRRFVFKSRFLTVFEVDDDTRQRIYEDDLELLKFGYQYLKTVFRIEPALKPLSAAPESPGPKAEATPG
ncbi:MAG: YkgJ family cysteine cluster protein [Deltaproteobacteria bacterium]|nr:YkgJ family cysteine cluster protein [Deltaproteobacteria bacterium]